MPPAQAMTALPDVSFDSGTLAAAQHDMRAAYLDGAPGALVSGTVWTVAAGYAAWASPGRAVWVLFVGGACIHPLAVLLVRLLGRSGRHAAGNPLGALAMATTFWMILMLPLAYAISLWRMELFFPAMLFVIAGRYLCFHTLYGRRLYWVLGAVLALAGWGLAAANASFVAAGLAGGAIEILFAVLLFVGARRS